MVLRVRSVQLWALSLMRTKRKIYNSNDYSNPKNNPHWSNSLIWTMVVLLHLLYDPLQIRSGANAGARARA
jgi:hypothetical protein